MQKNPLIFKKALQILAIKQYSRHELLEKLLQRNFPENEISIVLDHLEKIGYLNDNNYKNSLILSYLRKGFHYRSIPYKLKEKGLHAESEEITNLASENDLSVEKILVTLIEKNRKKSQNSLIRVIISHGHDYRLANEIIKKMKLTDFEEHEIEDI